MKFHTQRRFGWLIALLVASVVLAGCAKKPPACSAPETLAIIKDITVTNSGFVKTPVGNRSVLMWGDPQGIAKAFMDALKVEVSNVVLDGYDEGARRNTCRGNLKISTAAGSEITRPISYTVQLTEDQSQNNFIVAIDAYKEITDYITIDLRKHFQKRRFVGEWAGTYACDGIDNATEGPQGPFSMPVSMTVDDGLDLKLERTTVGGGVEVLKGLLDEEGVRLRGTGRNSPEDTWVAEYTGKIEGMTFVGNGFIKTPEGALLRSCKLVLALPDGGKK